MTTFTVIGDPHAKPDNLDKINTLFDMVEDLGNPTIWLGDLLDTKELVRGKCLNTYLKRFSDSKLQHYVLVGNHDWFNLECQEHSLEAFKVLKNVKVVDTLECIEGQWFAPYTQDIQALKEWTKCVGNRTLFCHADIKGFDYGNGLLSEEGAELADFKHTKRVISGHYHKYQEVGNITYLGTPFSHSFGESNQDKFIGIFDTKSNELKLIPTPFPQHKTYEIDCGEFSRVIHADYHNICRYVLKGTQEQIDAFVKPNGVKIIEQPSSALTKALVVHETDSSDVQFSKWSKEIKGYSDAILELGLEILKNV